MSINILGHYRFEGNADDSSVHGNNGTVVQNGTGIVESVTGIIGKGYKFTSYANESTDSCAITNYMRGVDLPRPFFISCWIQPSSNPTTETSSLRLFTRPAATYGSTSETILLYDGQIRLGNINISAGDITFPYTINQKYHVVGVWDTNENNHRIARLYVNGVLIGQHTSESVTINSNLFYTIGSWRSSGTNYRRTFDGIIDEFIIGTGVPSLPDIKRMMMGLRPLDVDPQPFYNDVQYYKNLVLADGGTFEEDVFYQCYSSGKRVVRKEANVWIVPGAYKTGVIYGINVVTKTLVPFTYSRNSVGTYFDKNGKLQIAAASIPQLNYDPITKQLRGYLIELASANLISNSLLNGNTTGWALNFIGITYNTGTTSYGRPFNTIYKTDSNSSRSFASNSINSIENTTYAFRCTLRAGNSSICSIGLGGVADISGGIWGETTNTGFRKISGPGNIIRTQGSLCYVSNLSSTEDTVVEIYRKYNSNGVFIRAHIYPDGTNSITTNASIQFSTPQLEVNALGVCTSQMDSSGGGASRQACSLVSSTGLINESASSIYMEGSRLSDGTSSNHMFYQSVGARMWYTPNNVTLTRIYDGTNMVDLPAKPNGERLKVVGSFGPEGLKFSDNSVVNKGSYDGTWSSNAIYLAGSSQSASNSGNHLLSFAIIHRQLTDAEHIELTK